MREKRNTYQNSNHLREERVCQRRKDVGKGPIMAWNPARQGCQEKKIRSGGEERTSFKTTGDSRKKEIAQSVNTLRRKVAFQGEDLGWGKSEGTKKLGKVGEKGADPSPKSEKNA